MSLLDPLSGKPARLPKITAESIRTSMLKRWCAPEWAIMWEVGNATGGRATNFADAVMMSLWPSRGLELHGVEIKVSRADYLREREKPQKAEAVGAFCDRWWIHAAPGVIDDTSLLPPAWGLRVYDGKAWRTEREAERTEAAPMSRAFLAALLRRADSMHAMFVAEATREAREEASRIVAEAREGITRTVEERVKQRAGAYTAALENYEKFETAFGLKLADRWGTDFAKLGRAAKALSALSDQYGDLVKRLRHAADEIEALKALVEVEPVAPTRHALDGGERSEKETTDAG